MTLAQIKDSSMSNEKVVHPHDANKSGFVEPKIVNKPWGHEEWVVVTDKYVMKRICVKQGELLSKQYHEQKMETLTVVEGECELLLGEEGDLVLANAKFYPFARGEAVHLKPKTIHTFKALTDVVLYEVSTPELLDVVRLEDKYARPATYKEELAQGA
jgi:mannose-6-phosphate isomerase